MSIADTYLSTQGLLNKVYDPTNNSLRVSGSGDVFFIPPQAFTINTGTPVISNANNIQSWEMDPAAIESVHCALCLPMFWRIINFDLWHGTRSAVASANVRHRIAVRDLASGNLITEATVSDQSVDVATPAQNTLLRRDNHIPNLTVNQDSLIGIIYERTANHANDTYTADSSFFGLRCRRVI